MLHDRSSISIFSLSSLLDCSLFLLVFCVVYVVSGNENTSRLNALAKWKASLSSLCGWRCGLCSAAGSDLRTVRISSVVESSFFQFLSYYECSSVSGGNLNSQQCMYIYAHYMKLLVEDWRYTLKMFVSETCYTIHIFFNRLYQRLWIPCVLRLSGEQ